MNVKIYSKPGCPYCVKTEEVLECIGVTPTVLTLDKDYNRTDFYEMFGEGSTFPRVLINDEVVGGAKETMEYLRANGKLA